MHNKHIDKKNKNVLYSHVLILYLKSGGGLGGGGGGNCFSCILYIKVHLGLRPMI